MTTTRQPSFIATMRHGRLGIGNYSVPTAHWYARAGSVHRVHRPGVVTPWSNVGSYMQAHGFTSEQCDRVSQFYRNSRI